MRNAISGMLSRANSVALRVTIKRVGGKLKCVLIEEIVDFAVAEGVYLFFANTGTPYVGKSVDIPRQIGQHESTAFLRNRLQNLKGLFSVSARDQRLIEQWVLDRVKDAQDRKPGELKGTANRRNPMNKSARQLLARLKVCP